MEESAPEAMPESAPELAPEPAGDELSRLKDELQECRDQYLRFKAEFDNFRKRKNRESEEIRKYAAAPFLEEILPVIDHFEIALDASHDRSDPQWSEGISYIARQLFDVLKASGLSEIIPPAGAEFDSGRHEAVDRRPSDEFEEGRVIEVVRKGYLLRDRLLRPAHVAVAASSASDVSGKEKDGDISNEQ